MKTQATLAEKIIARAAGVDSVSPGELVTAKVDLAMIHDSGGPRRVAPILEQLGCGLFDSSKVVLISDHFVPGDTAEGAQILRFTRDWASQQKLTFHDEQGICHVVLPERGHLKPGMFAVGGDSHSPTGGAFGTYMFGIGATDMAGVLATGEIWLQVPGTILLEWRNALRLGVCAKDMMLFLCGQLGMDGGQYQAVEYCGAAVTALPMQERMTLSNMAAELGAQAGLVAPDKTTENYLQTVGVEAGDWQSWQSDPGCKVLEHHVYDASELAPQVAAPHSPANSMAVNDAPVTAIDVAYIGACTGAKYCDLKAAAMILSNHSLAPGVKLMVAPASRRDQERAQREGLMSVFESAGARVLPNACGICAGYGTDRLAAGTTCLSSTARNFKGRMGDPESRVWLSSAMTVAASAITGKITDPREFLSTSEHDK